MRRLALAVLCLSFFFAPTLHAQTHEGAQMKTLPQAELDVVKVLLTQERAWNKGRIEEFATGYKNSADTLFIGNEVSRGYVTLLARYRKNYPDRATMGTLSFTDLEPHLLDDHYAIVTGKYQLDRGKKNGGPANGIFSLVLENTSEGWKIILDHTS